MAIFVIGTLAGISVFAFLLFTSSFLSTVSSELEVNLLKDECIGLKSQVWELTEKLRLVEQGNGQAREQFLMSSELHKAGPFGTVKSLRTNPTVHPDESVNPRLAKILSEVATVVALDNATVEFCKSNDVPVYQRDPDEYVDAVGKSGGNFIVSGLKFIILREFLQLGYSVLVSDVDIVYLQNPIDHLYRDSDVESMSDGHDNATAYGFRDVFDDPAMGWARYTYTPRIWSYNPGFFYIRPTIPSIELLDRIADRLYSEYASDRAVFNEELFSPSHPGYVALPASKRTMDIYQFMNSKVLFKTVRKDANLKKHRPVVVHVNFHPDKLPRMKVVFEFYVNGKQDALEPFPDVFERK